MPKAPNDAEIVEEFTRVTFGVDVVRIEVARIQWDGPHTPVTEWVAGVSLPSGASDEAIKHARFALLSRRSFFRICRHCNQRKPLGWMDENRICQSCGEQHYGVVH